MNYEYAAVVSPPPESDQACYFGVQFFECPLVGALAGANIKMINNILTPEICAQRCLELDACLSFDHSTVTGRCYIGNGIMGVDGQNTNSEKYRYYQRATDAYLQCRPGCMDPTMFNFDPMNNLEDGSCIPIARGCIDPAAFNYLPSANTDDGGCVPPNLGTIRDNCCDLY
jgi:hypothetical protein